LHHTATTILSLLSSDPGEFQWELVVQDLPITKLMLFYYFTIFVCKNIKMRDIQCYSFVHGMFLGLILILLTTIFYVFDSYLILPRLGFYSLLFLFILFIYSFCAVINFVNKKIMVQYRFKDYFTIIFLILAQALFFSKTYVLVLYLMIDRSLISEYACYTYEQHNVINMGYSFDTWLDLVKQNFKFSMQMQEYVFSLIPCTLYSAIISLLIKINRTS